MENTHTHSASPENPALYQQVYQSLSDGIEPLHRKEMTGLIISLNELFEQLGLARYWYEEVDSINAELSHVDPKHAGARRRIENARIRELTEEIAALAGRGWEESREIREVLYETRAQAARSVRGMPSRVGRTGRTGAKVVQRF